MDKIDREILKEKVSQAWEALGRDTTKLKLDNKSDKELTEALEKLRTIDIGFRLLLDKEGNHNLGIRLLATVFGEDIKESVNTEEDG